MTESTIGGAAFAALLSGGLANLEASADQINDLNVFPIPDGDTGDNMVSTLSGGVRAVQNFSGGVGEAAALAANGMLLGARGNSGVILSQMFSGVADSLSGREYATVPDISAAFSEGVERAYSSLSDPVEGTMLTVMRRAAEYAAENRAADCTPEAYFSLYEEEAARALEDTLNILPALKEAGVVDSGGAGLLCIVRGFISVLRGEYAEAEARAQAAAAQDMPAGAPDISLFTEYSTLTYGYCTEFLLRLTHAKTDLDGFSIEDFREKLSSLGTSVVAFRQGSMVKAHVHVMEPWQVLQFAQRYGEFLTVKIENMNIQHSEAQRRTSEDATFKKRAARKPYGVVAVSAGEGMSRAFRELGADVVIDGDAYGSPSVELFSEAIEAANADCVFVLPDDKNAVGAAEEAAKLSSCTARVLPTRSLGEGYVALSALDCESGDDDEIFSTMNAEVCHSAYGAVARAVRDADIGGVSVARDEYIAVTDKKILFSSPDKTDAAVALADILGAAERDFMIVFYGAGVSEAERQACRDKVERKFPSIEYYEIDGGQKTYDFIIVLQ